MAQTQQATLPSPPSLPPPGATPGAAASPVLSTAEAGTPVPVASPAATPVGVVPSSTAAGAPAAGTSPAGAEVSPPGSFAHEPTGFYTDTTVCIGCKACEVACKSWNGLSATNGGVNVLSGDSYDNTRHLDGEHWRHVRFIEQFAENRDGGRWLMMSDVCKHCVHAGCLEVCPTGAIIRTEFDTVVIQSDVCNGCRDCIGACPFGVIEINPVSRTAMKCTLCYDRMQVGLTPACAQACPTASIQFGPIAELRERATARVEQLNAEAKDEGRPEDAYLYGADDSILGGLNSFYLLVDKPGVYGLPENPKLPSRNLPANVGLSAAGAVGLGVLGLLGFRKRRMDDLAAEARAADGTADAPSATAGDGEARDA